jgi:hypothetical protein
MTNVAHTSTSRPSSAAQAAFTALSACNARFLDFAGRNPAGLERRSFAALAQKNDLVPYPLQPWPTFVTTRLIEEAGRMNNALVELIKSLPRRLFGNDPVKIADFYRVDPAYAAPLIVLLKDDLYMRGLLARGDYVNTAAGFQCLEINVGGNLGGWKAPIWARLYAHVPLFERFIREEGIAYVHRSPVQLFFRHTLEQARATGLLDGRIDYAFVVPAGRRSGPEVQAVANHELRRALQKHAPGVSGEVVVCDASELRLGPGDRLTWRGRRIHAVVEHTFGRCDRSVLQSLQAGQVNVYDGPVTELLEDKRNLALLSEHETSDLFDAAEREVIARHVPWTRVVHPGTTRYQGETVRLPDLLLARQEDLILKPAKAAKGEGVQIGRLLSPEVWRRGVETALATPDSWLVQAYVESLPYPYQHGEHGCADHDMVWGFFAFGPLYGGGFLRMMPKAGSRGVINAAQGATEGVLMEVEQ